MSIAAQLIVNGLIAGSIYALVALGYTMVYGILKFINFAHGEIFMLGGFIGYFLAVKLGVDLFVAILISMVLTALVGVLIERVAYRPLRKSPRLILLITAIAMSILLQSLAIIFFGANVKTYGIPSTTYSMFGASVTLIQIIIFITTFVALAILYFIIKKTKLGKAIRASADNLEVAGTIGINTNKVIAAVFAIGSAFAALGGVLVGIEQNIFPRMGVGVGIKAFTAAVVGGIGNIPGAVLGGFLIGLIENIGIWFIPSGYKDAIAFVILLIMLLVKPTGLLGAKSEEIVRKVEV